MIEFSETADLSVGDGVILILSQLGILLTVIWVVAGLMGVKHLAVPDTPQPRRNMRGTGGKWSEDTYAVTPSRPWTPAGSNLL
jgi:hypothetical protein